MFDIEVSVPYNPPSWTSPVRKEDDCQGNSWPYRRDNFDLEDPETPLKPEIAKGVLHDLQGRTVKSSWEPAWNPPTSSLNKWSPMCGIIESMDDFIKKWTSPLFKPLWEISSGFQGVISQDFLESNRKEEPCRQIVGTGMSENKQMRKTKLPGGIFSLTFGRASCQFMSTTVEKSE